jgi:hypothetical protein
MDLIDPAEWVVDVALEIRQEGHVIQWLTSAHRRLLKYVLPSAENEQIDVIMTSKKHYLCDLSAQLDDLGGCRVEPGSREKKDEVTYISIYTTDKSATYQLHSGIFAHRQACDLLPGKIDKLVKDMDNMGEVFRACCGDGEDDSEGLEGCARLEIRIPLANANDVLLTFPGDLLQASVISIPLRVWW